MCQVASVKSNSLWPYVSSVHGILQAKILQSRLPFLSSGVLPDSGLNLGLPHCRQILYCLSHQGSLCLLLQNIKYSFLCYILGPWWLSILLEKEMATHSSVLAWRIPGTRESGGLPSMGSHRVGHDWSDLAAAAAVCIYPHYPQDWKNSVFIPIPKKGNRKQPHNWTHLTR